MFSRTFPNERRCKGSKKNDMRKKKRTEMRFFEITALRGGSR